MYVYTHTHTYNRNLLSLPSYMYTDKQFQLQSGIVYSAGNSPVYVSDSDPDPDLKWWVQGLSLYEDDKEVLLGGKELTGNIINAAHCLLRSQFSHIGGFQDTDLVHHLNYKAIDPCVSSVQILHTGTYYIIYTYRNFIILSLYIGETNHWLCTCSSRGNATVMVMDSLGLFMGLSESTRLQICRIYNSIVPHHESSLKISKLSVQQQKGYLDCGVFSIAYAVEVCLGRNPQYAFFDQRKMRQHLYLCLNQGVLKLFPRISGHSEELPRPSLSSIDITLYCKCKMPESYDDMVCCDGCDKWYHFKCINLRSNHLPKKWICPSCTL